MERKDFIRTACSVCLVLGAGASLLELTGCSALPIYKTAITDNKITVPVSLFANTPLQIIRPAGFDYDIALRKETDGSYHALLLRCTHADNQLVSTGSTFVCNLHGSVFDSEGGVKQGPAEQPLKKLPALLNADNIIIKLN